MEADDEEGEGEGWSSWGDVGGAGGLWLVAQVVGAVTVGLCLQHRNTSTWRQSSNTTQEEFLTNENKTRPESLDDATTKKVNEVNAKYPCEILL